VQAGLAAEEWSMPNRRVPTALKILRGNPGQRPLNLDEPQPEALEAACPDVLTDPVAVAEWARGIVPAIGIGQVTAADRTLAIAHCQLWATWVSQTAEANRQPHTVRIGRHRSQSPVRNMANKTLVLLAQVDEKLGFSPCSRGKIQVAGSGTIRASIDRQRDKFFSTTRG